MKRSSRLRRYRVGTAILARIRTLLLTVTLIATAALSIASAQTPSPILVAYAGQNETVGPMWVGIEKGTFKKYGLDVRLVQMRNLGDTATVTQALGSGGVDATVIPYSFSEAAKRAGANVLADIGKLNFPYQGTTICFLRESAASSPDQISRLLKGLVDAVVLIHDPNAKPEIGEILRKAFRFPKPEDAEASYKVLAIMATVELMPDPAAWKIVQKIVAKINPKVAQVDFNQLVNPVFVRNLEDSGVLAAARSKIR